MHILQLLSMYHPVGEEILNQNAKVTKMDEFDEEKVVDFLKKNEVDGIMLRAPAKITAPILNSSSTLKAVSGAGVGLDNIDVEHATKRNVKVLHAPKINTIATAEHAVSLILAVMKNITEFNSEMMKGNFSFRDGKYTRELKGKKLGLIGLGTIAQEVAKMMRFGFGMEILSYVRSISDERQATADSLEVVLTKDMEQVFKECDVISVHIPLTATTDKIIDEKLFSLMKPDAIFINTSRGGVINEIDLVQAIQANKIAGAGVDVFAKEPPEANHPFLSEDRIIKTPHIGGISLEAAQKTSETIANNLIAAIKGDKVNTIVNSDQLKQRR